MFQFQELGLAVTITNTLLNESEPQGFAEASKSEAWVNSMREELSSLKNNKIGALVDLPPGRKAIRCDRIYKARKNKHGAVYLLKSRLVAKGLSQKPGIDSNNTFTPVRDKLILRFVLAFCPASWIRTFSARHRHILSIWEPQRNHIHDPTRGF